MKIKIIATGSSKWERFIHRWGVSFLLGEDLLFDTFGDPRVLLNNLRKYKIDLAKIKHIVLSHDHWDHISGLWSLLTGRKDISVYICPGFTQETKDRIAAFGVRVVEVEPFMEIREGVFSTGQIKSAYANQSIFEQALVVKFLKNINIITGCAHPGIVNIVNIVKQHFLKEHICYILGGFHLKDNSQEVNSAIIQELRDLGIRRIAPMHCTGKQATEMMREAFGYGFMHVKEGNYIEL
ncbi:MAG: MBL fold metallo-hydrolase [Candidatus Omnitrophota bacterium]